MAIEGEKKEEKPAGGYAAAKALPAQEEVASMGSGTKRIRSKYTVNPGYTPVADCFCVRFSPDDQYLAASFANGAIHVYSAETGRQEFVLNSTPATTELSATPLPTTQLRWRPHGAASKTQSVLISVNAEFDGQILQWHIKSGKCLHTITEKGNQLFCLDYFNDGSQFATAGRDRLVRVYDEATKRQVMTLQGGDMKVGFLPGPNILRPLPTTQLRWRPHGAASKTQSVLISVNAEFDGQILQWHIKSGKCLHTITEKGNQLFCLDYFNDGSQFATAGRDRLVRVYDEATKRQVMTLQGGDMKETAGHSNRVFSLKYHPEDPNLILSGGWDNTVQLWDTRKGISVRSLWNCYICGDSVDISTDGKQILTGSWRTENALQLWDFGTGKCMQNVDWESASSKNPCMIFAAQFSKDTNSNMILAGGSQENEAKFFLRQPAAQPVPFGALVAMPALRSPQDLPISSPQVLLREGGCSVLSKHDNAPEAAQCFRSTGDVALGALPVFYGTSNALHA
ncbi:putative WD repeat-containing protein [Symbiodinium microadriaticum]|uniref:Putative WD repeat-containing protein n=1 Tax=Symbiodinium microadriaticum TaxID=2951 RepID=A0A1Q9CWC4_SYMMI|nr:putative WD repeat-containing protein [Symbiodinium microadriaticum]